MQSIDLNLLEVLDALLQEGSVTGAAKRLHLTPPAISRSLNRLRAATGDPLLVRTGRHLTPTAVAERLRDPAHRALADVRQILSPQAQPSDSELERSLDTVFSIRTGYDGSEAFGPRLVEAVRRRAPGVRLRFIGDVDPVDALRSGSIDLDIGSPVEVSSEPVHRQRLVTDNMVIVGRRNGRLAKLCDGRDPTPADLAAVAHVTMSRQGLFRGPLDDQLALRGLTRDVVATAPGFPSAMLIADRCDLVCLAPGGLSSSLRIGRLRTWPVPVELPPLVIEQLWHQRTHTDPAHRWLRARVHEVVSAAIE